jgi:cobalt-zinc-cadmium resistance protein CzcA
MLNAIIDWSLHNRFVVLAGALVFIALGGWSLSQLDIDAFPDTTPVQVQINTIAPGLAPEEVERQITYPVEQAINGLPRLQQLRSISKFGISQVVVVFADGTDIYFARQMVNERLTRRSLPLHRHAQGQRSGEALRTGARGGVDASAHGGELGH